MLSIRPLLLITLLLLSIPLSSNPFHKKENTPEIRSVNQTNSDLITLQLKFRKIISEGLNRVKDGNGGLLLIIAAAFIYGVLHAAGPGHRKSVLFTIFISKQSSWWEPAVAGSLSAIIHGLSAVLLILFFNTLSRSLLTTRINSATKFMEVISFSLLALFSLTLLITSLIKLIKRDKKERSSGHLVTLLITSVVPCPGAILILILSLSLNILSYGVVSVIALSLGMGITVSFAGYLGRAGRVGIFNSLKRRKRTITIISEGSEITGFIFLFIFSIWMLYPLLIQAV